MTVIMTTDGKACLKSKQELSESVPGARVLRQHHSAWGLSLAHCLSQRVMPKASALCQAELT